MSLLKPKKKINGVPCYDTFQITVVGKIYNQINSFAEIEEKADKIKKSLKSLETVLPLLYEVRYFYQDKLYNMITSGIVPPFKLTDDEVMFFDRKFAEIFRASKPKYKPKEILNKYKLDKKDLYDLRDIIFHDGLFRDPMAKWYHFLKTIRIEDRQKFDRIEKSVLLAHDYYILAELITLFYRDAIGEDIIDPEDMTDLTGGKWKYRTCENCKKKMRIVNHRQKLCTKCRTRFAHSKGVRYRCDKCGQPLLKYADGAEILNKIFTGKRKPNKKETVSSINLLYGKIRVFIQCDCGKLNHFEIDKGWF